MERQERFEIRALLGPPRIQHDLHDMPKDELIIQLIKIALGLAFGAYFLWWSLAVLHRLPSHL